MTLVTNLDGTQTFGLSNEAMFSTAIPIAQPQYYDTFPLYLHPVSQRYPDVIQAVLESLNQVSTPLNAAFFSKSNVDVLQNAILVTVQNSLGVRLDRQSDWQLLLIMRQKYLAEANNWPDDVDAEVARLDSLVLQDGVASIAKNVSQWFVSQNTVVNGLPTPMLWPADASTNTPYPITAPNATLPPAQPENGTGMPLTAFPTPYPLPVAPVATVAPAFPDTDAPGYPTLYPGDPYPSMTTAPTAKESFVALPVSSGVSLPHELTRKWNDDFVHSL
jgi:hypothetical protein